MRRNKAQLNAISRSYTKRANEQALAHIKYIYKCTEKDIEEFKRKYNYKTNSYVVLERCIVRKGGLKWNDTRAKVARYQFILRMKL